MKMLISQTEFNQKLKSELIPLQCKYCINTFFKSKQELSIKYTKKLIENRYIFCNYKCAWLGQIKKQHVICKQCSLSFSKALHEIKRSKNNFCSKSCAAVYNNTHKKFGLRRSKLEKWLENELKILYPDIYIEFSKKSLGTELDIFIPSLKLAFEINGIVHYKPIYGEEKFKQIQHNDSVKSKICEENNINLTIINSTDQKRFTPKTSEAYLELISSKIRERY